MRPKLSSSRQLDTGSINPACLYVQQDHKRRNEPYNHKKVVTIAPVRH